MDPEPTSRGAIAAKKRLITRFTHCDTILTHGPISSMSFSLARNGVSNPNYHCWISISIRTGEVSSGASYRHRVASSRRVYTLPGMKLVSLEGRVLTDASAERSPYQSKTEGAYCGRRSWNVGISDQAVSQGQRRLIRSALEPIPLRE